MRRNPAPKPLSKLHILMADDQEFIRRVLQGILVELGIFRIEQARDGGEAIELMRRRQPDLLITDLQMKPVNGLELLRRIRAGMTRAPRDLPVLALSGHSERHVVGTALLLDVSGFIVKPVKAIELIEKIQRALTRPVELRSPPAYQKVNTDIEELLRKGQAAELEGHAGTTRAQPPHTPELGAADARGRRPTAAAPPAVAKRGQELPIHQLEPGMRLAEDIRAHDGSVLVRAGIEMSQQLVDRVKDIAVIVDIDRVWIDNTSEDVGKP